MSCKRIRISFLTERIKNKWKKLLIWKIFNLLWKKEDVFLDVSLLIEMSHCSDLEFLYHWFIAKIATEFDWDT